jgi:hypothetical protein
MRPSQASVLLPVLALLISGLAGCAGQEYPWYREGLTDAQLKQDLKECNAQAGDYGFLNPDLTSPASPQPGGGPTGRVVVRDEGDLFRTCMNSRGYARVPPPPQPAGAK